MNINTLQIYNRNLLPGMLLQHQSKERFLDWFQKRYSERSNTASRQLRGILFGQGNRELINKTTHALSLSDCYWLKTVDESISFFNISPYFNDFWQGNGEYNDEAIPTLYVNGFLTKYWENKYTLIKKSEEKEILCAEIAKALDIATVDIQIHINGIAVKNFTSEDIMFESAETCGLMDPEGFTAEDILNVFSKDGFNMLFLDALIGNGDRHAGNFGFLRDANTGEYLGMAPLFDYDHAYDSRNINDVMIKEVKALSLGRWSSHYNDLINRAKKIDILDEYMRHRLKALAE